MRYALFAIFIAVMLGLRYLFVGWIDTGGHWAFIAIMACIFAFGFWWEARYPTQRER